MRNYSSEIQSSGLSVIGPVREDNQDAIHLPDHENLTGPGLLFAVADGMGGYAHGGIASLLALEALSSTLATSSGRAPVHKVLRRAVATANLRVYRKAQQLGAGHMGTTLTAAYILGNRLYLTHVGDSRAYLIRNGQAVCLSTDHTAVGDMVRSKLLSSDKIRTHAQRSILTKAVGLSLFIQPDISEHRLQEDDRFVLCSDGVWSVVQDEDLAQIASDDSSMERISQRLIDLAIQNKTDDNASVVVFHMKRLIPASAIKQSQKGTKRNWFKNLRKMVS